MAVLDPDAVDKLVDLLRLPVGGEGDPRAESSADLIQGVSEELGSLVFDDTNWYDSQPPGEVVASLEPWFDATSAAELVTKATGPDAPEAWHEFLAWSRQLVSGWARVETGDMVAAQDAEVAPLGSANPQFEPDRVPGTEFYRYVDEEYLYAAMADAAPEEWRTLEARYEQAGAAPVDAAPPDVVMGYRNDASVLPGTAFYRQLDDGGYVYAPTERAAPDDWHAYEYWANGTVTEDTGGRDRFAWLDADPALPVRLERVLSYQPEHYEEYVAPYLDTAWGTGWEEHPDEHKRAWLDQLLTGLEERPPAGELTGAAQVDATAVIAGVLDDSPELAELGDERLQQLFAEVMAEFESAEQPAAGQGGQS